MVAEGAAGRDQKIEVIRDAHASISPRWGLGMGVLLLLVYKAGENYALGRISMIHPQLDAKLDKALFVNGRKIGVTYPLHDMCSASGKDIHNGHARSQLLKPPNLHAL